MTVASEASLWTQTKKWLVSLDPQRIEDKISRGIPDVNTLLGWIELKHFDDWNVHGYVNLDDIPFTREQRIWLRRRWLAGGGSFLLMRVKNTIYLFNGEAAFNLQVQLYPEEATKCCIGTWRQTRLNKEDLISCLKYRV